jgi:hypothetical protein
MRKSRPKVTGSRKGEVNLFWRRNELPAGSPVKRAGRLEAASLGWLSQPRPPVESELGWECETSVRFSQVACKPFVFTTATVRFAKFSAFPGPHPGPCILSPMHAFRSGPACLDAAHPCRPWLRVHGASALLL